MIEASTAQIWIIIIAMGIGTYVIRFSFLGLIGNRDLPSWLLKMLRFTPVAVLPGVVAPMLIGSNAAHSADPLRLSAAMVTLVVGLLTRNVLYAIIAGLGVFFGLGALIG
ncbi:MULTISPECIES: AzlD domain-containing protein [Pacificibacter]|uniref:AzlD domain-containing protein n=1 Tax=Pacificibacter TaxID=1042323 RepID=UPI001C097F69|nr:MULTISPECIES: AzlD domain-containing protein [Pacificibacter]MBU2934690.1 AzlD domain-containing protein [Pacificibacter marinus]MDO6616868.1 AzlD domain-containing protein [Pacificibacter sp. 1_MG-2023]